MASPVNNSGTGFLFRVEFPCDLGAVREASLQARDFLAGQGMTPEDLLACELTLVEACNNAVLYASPEDQKPILIQLLKEGTTLEMQVIDHTPGFDWPSELQLPDPEAEHGRGLFIIQSLMDDIVYLRGQKENRLIMRKSKIFCDHSPATPLSEQLEKTKEKLALTEQVIHGMARELWTQIVSAHAEQEKVDNRLLSHELEIARQIQHSLLPKTFPKLPGFGLSGFCVTARQVGGDFYDVLPLAPDVVLLVVADVMGKGVPAALFAATLRTLLRSIVQWVRRPGKLLRRINRLMHDDLSGVDMFITAQLVLVDMRVGRLVVASAGHCPLLLSDGSGDIETLAPEGMPLGILPEVEFEEEVIPFGPSSCALLYSDGLTDARNVAGDLFGQQRLMRWMLQNLGRELSAVELTQDIQSQLKLFQGTVSPTDDQTALIFAGQPSVISKPEPSVSIPILTSVQSAVSSG